MDIAAQSSSTHSSRVRASTATTSPQRTPCASSACASTSTRSPASCHDTSRHPSSRSSRYAGALKCCASTYRQRSGAVRRTGPALGSVETGADAMRAYGTRAGTGGEKANLYNSLPMRTIWNGSISFGLVNIPIGLALATQRSDVAFRTLHRECGTPIKQKRWCPFHERDVEPDELVKGWEVVKGEFVLVEESDLEAVALQRSSSIEILRFVRLADVDPVYFDRTYYLAPASAEAQRRPYVLLLEAMKETGMAAIGKFVLWGKENLCLIRPHSDSLALETLFFAEDVRSRNEIEDAVAETEVKKPELDLARQVIESIAGDFDPEEFRNEYREEEC